MLERENNLAALKELETPVHSLLLKKKRNTYPFLFHEKQKAHYIEHKQKLWNKPVSLVLAAAAAAKLLQSCPPLCNPIDGSPLGSSVHRIFQAWVLEWVAISFSSAWKWKVKVKSLSRIRLLATPWTAAYQAPLSIGFSRQEYWSGVPLPSPTV